MARPKKNTEQIQKQDPEVQKKQVEDNIQEDENIQLIIKKNNVEIAILTEPLIINSFKKIILEINKKNEKPLDENIIFSKNQLVGFPVEETFKILYSILYDLMKNETDQIKTIALGKDLNFNQLPDEVKESEVQELILQYIGLHYYFNIIEIILFSYAYSKQRNKNDLWSYIIEDKTIDINKMLLEIYPYEDQEETQEDEIHKNEPNEEETKE